MSNDLGQGEKRHPRLLNDMAARAARICDLSASLLISPRSSYIFKKAKSSITPRFLSYQEIRVHQGEKGKESTTRETWLGDLKEFIF